MKYLFFALTFILLISSCRSARNLSSALTKKDSMMVIINPSESDSALKVAAIINKIDSQKVQYSTFSAKVKIDYTDDKGKKFDLNAFLRMKKDSAIWLSVTIPLLGTEAFRVLITPDTVSILDKINKTIQYQSFDILKNLTNLPFDFYKLQDLFIGNPVFLDHHIIAYKENDALISITSNGSAFKNFSTFSNAALLLQRSKLDDNDTTKSRAADLSYQDYETFGKVQFSTKRNIMISDKTKLDIGLDFKQILFDASLNFPFSIPSNYKLK
jgi:hypothetical protein